MVIVLGVLVLACSGQRWGFGETNVVWIVIDALRADQLGCYGYEIDTSPLIDHLASKNVPPVAVCCDGMMFSVVIGQIDVLLYRLEAIGWFENLRKGD